MNESSASLEEAVQLAEHQMAAYPGAGDPLSSSLSALSLSHVSPSFPCPVLDHRGWLPQDQPPYLFFPQVRATDSAGCQCSTPLARDSPWGLSLGAVMQQNAEARL